MLIPFSNIQKSTLTNPKEPDVIFLLIPFSNINKNEYLQIIKTLTQLLLISFTNIKKAHLQILKNLMQFFCSSLFQILKKRKTYKSLKT